MMSTRRVLLATTSSRLPPAFLSTFRLGLSSTSASVRDFSSPSPPSTPATPPIVRNSSGNTLPKPIIPFVPDFVLKAMGYYSSETTQIRRSENLFRAAELQASKANFYTLGNISKDFKTKHILLCLHVWCIHKVSERSEPFGRRETYTSHYQLSSFSLGSLAPPYSIKNSHNLASLRFARRSD